MSDKPKNEMTKEASARLVIVCNHNCSISALVYVLGSSRILPRRMMEKLHQALLQPGLRLLLTRMRTRTRGSRGDNIAVGV